MITSFKQATTENVFPAATLSVSEVIKKLSGICENRHQALSAYPYAKGVNQRFAAIANLRASLSQARSCLNPKEAISICLKTELNFHQIAPSATSRLRKNYILKLNAIMDDCRTYLGRRAQI